MSKILGKVFFSRFFFFLRTKQFSWKSLQALEKAVKRMLPVAAIPINTLWVKILMVCLNNKTNTQKIALNAIFFFVRRHATVSKHTIFFDDKHAKHVVAIQADFGAVGVVGEQWQHRFDKSISSIVVDSRSEGGWCTIECANDWQRERDVFAKQ